MKQNKIMPMTSVEEMLISIIEFNQMKIEENLIMRNNSFGSQKNCEKFTITPCLQNNNNQKS